MRKILNLFKKIENYFDKNPDKLKHLTIGLILSTFYVLNYWLILLPIIAGVSKELYDKYIKKTKFDWEDIFYTYLGCLPILILHNIKLLINI